MSILALGLLVVVVFAVLLLLGFGIVVLVLVLGRRPVPQRPAPARTGPPPSRGREPEQLPARKINPVPSREGHCPECGAALPPDSPEGLCPQCLLKGGLGSAADLPPDGRNPRTTPYPGPGAAASPAELAAYFAQLEVLELLGRGGMGAVYKARQPNLDRLVALKVLPPEAGQDPAFVERFTREARALARLSHPHIVAVHDFGQAGGLYYFLMEFVDGVNLRQLLQAGPLEPRQALEIIPQICDALHYAHGEGVVHRDIKPENILLDRKGRVKIADFGLAKLLGRGPGEFTLTSSRQVMGTLHYMAPEQMERPLEVDHRADIYSLGVIFYEMLTHELPLGRFPPPSAKAGVDARLDDVVLRALEKEPDRRYQHASDVKTDVEAIATGPVGNRRAPAAVAEPPSRPRPARAAARPRESRGTALIVLLVLALMLPLCCVPLALVGATFFVYMAPSSGPDPVVHSVDMPVPVEDQQPMRAVKKEVTGAGPKATPAGDGLIAAAAKGDEVAVRGFLAGGTNPSSTDKDGSTALIAAARNGHLRIVQTLLDKGADPKAKDKGGKTALDYARENGHEKIVAVLRARGDR